MGSFILTSALVLSLVASCYGQKTVGPGFTKSTLQTKNTATTTTTTTVAPTPTQPCSTSNGQTCIFPFKYDGRTFSECTDYHDSDDWCATSLTADGSVFNYGYCTCSCVKATNNECTTVDGAACVFPFRYNGNDYTACTDVDYSGSHWCATSIDSNRNYITWGECSNGCKSTCDN